MKAVFLSYRRADKWAAIHLGDSLQKMIPEVSMFRDTRSIHAGEEWAQSIDNALEKSEVMLAVIGPGWLDSLRAKDRDPAARDWVLYEIRHALEKRIRVIPILMGEETPMPRREDLPEEIRPLLDRQWIRVTDAHLDDALDTLAAEIRAVVGIGSAADGPVLAGAAVPGSPPPTPSGFSGPSTSGSSSRRGLWILLGVVGGVMLVGGGFLLFAMGYVSSMSDGPGLPVALTDVPVDSAAVPFTDASIDSAAVPFLPANPPGVSGGPPPSMQGVAPVMSIGGSWLWTDGQVVLYLAQNGNSVVVHMADEEYGNVPIGSCILNGPVLTGQLDTDPLRLQLSPDGRLLTGTLGSYGAAVVWQRL